MSGSQVNPNGSNKFYNGRKQQDSLDRTLWEMRNQYRQYYRNPTPNSHTPSSTVLNSPIFDDIKFIDQYQKVTSDSAELAGNGLSVLNSQNEGASNFYASKDSVVFDDIDETRGSWMNSQYGNRLVTGFSPTSSQSSHSGNVSATGSDGSNSKNRIIGDIQIADLQQSPRRLGSTTHSNGQQSPIDPSIFIEKIDKIQQHQNAQRIQLHSPVNFPKRAPGFPKVILQKL
jgi:hypothetical protein